jgi:fumarate reductase subunit C
LFRLGQGEAAWAQWRAFLASPLSLALHGVLLLAFAYHAWTWFRIMPRTLPPIRFRGTRVTAATITGIGLVATLVASALVYVVVARLAA